LTAPSFVFEDFPLSAIETAFGIQLVLFFKPWNLQCKMSGLFTALRFVTIDPRQKS
jgi:hypothetical protein